MRIHPWLIPELEIYVIVFYAGPCGGGSSDTEMKVPLPPPSWGSLRFSKVLSFKAWSRSEYSFTCCACWQDFFLLSLCLLNLFNFISPQSSLIIKNEMCGKQWIRIWLVFNLHGTKVKKLLLLWFLLLLSLSIFFFFFFFLLLLVSSLILLLQFSS